MPYAKDRGALDEAIAKKQAIAFRRADMQLEQYAVRQLVRRTASSLDRRVDGTRGPLDDSPRRFETKIQARAGLDGGSPALSCRQRPG